MRGRRGRGKGKEGSPCESEGDGSRIYLGGCTRGALFRHIKSARITKPGFYHSRIVGRMVDVDVLHDGRMAGNQTA